jgi:NAD(P)H dehydrogenase (quinone)
MSDATPPRTRVYVVSCVPVDDSFIAAVRERVLRGLAAAGADVRHCDLYAEGFQPELSEFEWRRHVDLPDTKPEAAAYAANLTWAQSLVFVYPTWWTGQPAMLKGFIDRVFMAGVAWHLPEGADRLRPGLRHVRRIVGVTTHGSPKHINMLEGEAGKRIITRSLRVLCHPLARGRWLAMYAVDRSTPARRVAYLDHVERRIASAARVVR